MSRSYKKHSWCGDHKGTGKKRTAWKTVRQWQKDHPDILLQGGAYKKIYETWEICDYGWTMTWEQYWASCIKWHEHDMNRGWGAYKELNEKEEYRYWYKHYKAK